MLTHIATIPPVVSHLRKENESPCIVRATLARVFSPNHLFDPKIGTIISLEISAIEFNVRCIIPSADEHKAGKCAKQLVRSFDLNGIVEVFEFGHPEFVCVALSVQYSTFQHEVVWEFEAAIETPNGFWECP